MKTFVQNGKRISILRILTFICFFQFSGIANGYTYSSFQSFDPRDSVALTMSLLKRSVPSRSSFNYLVRPILLITNSTARIFQASSLTGARHIQDHSLDREVHVKFNPCLMEKQASYLNNERQAVFSGLSRVAAYSFKKEPFKPNFMASWFILFAMILGMRISKRLAFARRSGGDDWNSFILKIVHLKETAKSWRFFHERAGGMCVKVLIVDDETHITSLLQDYFEDKEDHEISIAHSGQEAIKKALDLKPELIILDIMMPGLNGFQVIESLKQHEETAEIPIILSSIIDGPSPEEKKRLGIVDFLRKPINFTKLNRLIEEFTANRPQDPAKNRKKTGRAVTVAIIEDDEEDVELLSVGLKNVGCDVHSALDGESGIKLVSKLLPDIVILDYVLPTISGVDVIRRLKSSEKTRHIPIILISAYISLNYKEKLFIFRDDKMSEGPFSIKDLCHKIKEAVVNE